LYSESGAGKVISHFHSFSFFFGGFKPMSAYQKITPPTRGSKTTFRAGEPVVPDDPIIPFIRGDGTGVDLWPATQRVLDAAVETAYSGKRKITWFKVYAGDEACERYGTYQYLPEDTLKAIREYGVAIKGPLTTPIGGGIRSLNVALRQIHDLYACVRPCKYYPGTPSPHRSPEELDVIIYRENTEDIYLGIEWKEGSPIARKLIDLLNRELIPATPEHGKKQLRLDSGIGIKPISKSGTQRLVRRAMQHALRLPKHKQQVTLVHKGNIMKYTEGAFRDWGYELATTEFRNQCVTERESWILGNKEENPNLSLEENARKLEPGYDALTADKKGEVCNEVKKVLDGIWTSHGNGKWKDKIMVNDRIADSIFQQIQTRPAEYSILATMNLNGDYLSDAAAAIVGGLGMGPGANIGDTCAIFEATHGTAPKHAGLDKVNPGSLILSGVMMLEYLGWQEAADLVKNGIGAAISNREVTYDLARLMEPPVKSPLKCSEFGEAIIRHFRPGEQGKSAPKRADKVSRTSRRY
jgi:isocitrate dehydrogenase